MTCEQFQHLNRPGWGLFHMTRAERRACSNHFHGCELCRDWTMKHDDERVPINEVLRLAVGDALDEEALP